MTNTAEWTNHRGNYGPRHTWRCSRCRNAIISALLVRRDKMPDVCPSCGAAMTKAIAVPKIESDRRKDKT